eukprot:g15955.t1
MEQTQFIDRWLHLYADWTRNEKEATTSTCTRCTSDSDAETLCSRGGSECPEEEFGAVADEWEQGNAATTSTRCTSDSEPEEEFGAVADEWEQGDEDWGHAQNYHRKQAPSPAPPISTGGETASNRTTSIYHHIYIVRPTRRPSGTKDKPPAVARKVPTISAVPSSVSENPEKSLEIRAWETKDRRPPAVTREVPTISAVRVSAPESTGKCLERHGASRAPESLTKEQGQHQNRLGAGATLHPFQRLYQEFAGARIQYEEARFQRRQQRLIAAGYAVDRKNKVRRLDTFLRGCVEYIDGSAPFLPEKLYESAKADHRMRHGHADAQAAKMLLPNAAFHLKKDYEVEEEQAIARAEMEARWAVLLNPEGAQVVDWSFESHTHARNTRKEPGLEPENVQESGEKGNAEGAAAEEGRDQAQAAAVAVASARGAESQAAQQRGHAEQPNEGANSVPGGEMGEGAKAGVGAPRQASAYSDTGAYLEAKTGTSVTVDQASAYSDVGAYLEAKSARNPGGGPEGEAAAAKPPPEVTSGKEAAPQPQNREDGLSAAGDASQHTSKRVLGLHKSLAPAGSHQHVELKRHHSDFAEVLHADWEDSCGRQVVLPGDVTSWAIASGCTSTS